MYQEVTNFLKSYITQQEIPLHQILTPADIHNISATVSVLGKSKGNIQFDDTYERIFLPLGDKGEKILDHQILSSVFEINSTEVPEVKIMELAYYCLMLLRLKHDLPVERILELVTTYILEMIIPDSQTKYSFNKEYPVSNLISIGNDNYIRTNGLKIIPPTEAISLEFINKIKQLLIP